MRTIRLRARITKDHELRGKVPEDLPEGTVDVTLQLGQAPGNAAEGELRQFLDRLAKSPRKTRTKEEIDRYLEAERASWE